MLNHSIKLINVTQFGCCTALIVNGVFITERDDDAGSFEDSVEFDIICDNLAEALNAPMPIPIFQYTPPNNQWGWDEVLHLANTDTICAARSKMQAFNLF